MISEDSLLTIVPSSRSQRTGTVTRADPGYTGRVTVPVLWDRQEDTIVSNESAEIIRMFNAEFDAIGDASVDFYPEPLRAEIDAVNEFVYPRINDGVYRCGFATTQKASS